MVQKGKERPPLETVQKVKDIFGELGIELIETAYDCSDGLKSVCLYDPKCKWRVWGKGTGSDWALASAYGEAVERLSNFALYRTKGDGSKWPGEKRLPISELWSLDDLSADFIRLCKEDSKADREAFIEEYAGAAEISFVPYHSVKTGGEVYLPEDVITLISGSNAMAAGNTEDEALCQALCEVFERYAKFEIILKGFTPPEISKDKLKELCPEILDLIKAVEQESGCRVYVRDASLGKKLPVVNVLFADEEKGLYASRFGSSPDFGIALERCLTELTQGWDNLRIREHMVPRRAQNKDILEFRNLSDSFRNDMADLPDSFFEGAPSWEFAAWPKYGSSNSEWVKSFLDMLLEMSNDVYYRKTDFLGLWAVRLYVPGISVLPFKLGAENLENTRLREIIHCPEQLCKVKSPEEAKKLLECITGPRSSVLNRSDSAILFAECKTKADELRALLAYMTGDDALAGEYANGDVTGDGRERLEKIFKTKDRENALSEWFGISEFMQDVGILKKEEQNEALMRNRREQERKLRDRLWTYSL